LIVPQKEQVYESLWTKFRLKHDISQDGLIRDLPQQKIIKYVPKDVIIIDLLPAFINEQDYPYYYKIDIHTNILGNKRTAELIFAKMIKEGIINGKKWGQTVIIT